MKKYILLSLMLITMLSCIKTIEFDDEGIANLLVLNSIIWPDSAFSASLQKSTSILTQQAISQGVEGTLDLYEDGTLLTHLSSPVGLFRAAQIKPKSGSNYRIVVTSGGRQIEAETMIPTRAEVVSIDSSSTATGYGSRTFHLKIRIKDAPGEDYYRIVFTNENLVQVNNQDEARTRQYFLTKTQNWINSEDPVFESVYNNFGDELLDMGPENIHYIFPDDYFEDKEYSVQLDASSSMFHHGGYGNNKMVYERQTVHVQRLSKDLYTYLKSLNLYNNYHENPFAEPVPVYSNVKSGAGILAGFNDDAKTTFEKIYIPFSMDTITVQEGYQY